MENEQSKHKEIFLYFSNVVASARGLVGEPKIYGPLRMLTTMINLYDLLKRHYDFKDAELDLLMEDMQDISRLSITDEERFITEMDDAVLRMVKLVKSI